LISPRWIIRKATGKKQLIIAGVVTEVCVAFSGLVGLGGRLRGVRRDRRLRHIRRDHATFRVGSHVGSRRATNDWFGVAGELHRDWRNDVEGLGTLFSNHIPDYRNLITAYTAVKGRK
jgi:hypothetical protein